MTQEESWLSDLSSPLPTWNDNNGIKPKRYLTWNYFKKELPWALFIAGMFKDSISRQKNSTQGLGFIFIFEIVELVSLEHKPTGMPGLDKASLLPQPPTLHGLVLPLALLGVLRGVMVLLHYQADGPSYLTNNQQQK